MKTNKSYAKRIKVTRNGKIIARKPGQDHYNALASGGERRAKRGTQGLTMSTRTKRRFLAGI
jgi:ribosomal protein L35